MKYFRQLMEEATPPEGGNPQGGGVESPSWYYSAPNEESQFEGIAGNGDVPEWFKVDKYKSVDEQARAYSDLEKRFGGFTGSPEEYQLPEGFEDSALDSGLLDITKEIGKEYQMSQKMFNDLVSKVTNYQLDQHEKAIENAKTELGPDADKRIQDVNNWLNTNAPKEVIDMVVPMANTAGAIQALEFFISKTKNTPVASQEASRPEPMTESEYAGMLMAKDSHGNLKIATDPEYKAKIDKITAERMKR